MEQPSSDVLEAVHKAVSIQEKYHFEFSIFDNFINKYRKNDVDEIVYRLSYASKYVVVKGKTLAGSLIMIAEAFYRYRQDLKRERFEKHLYKPFFDHILSNKGRFRIKTIAKRGKNITHFDLLKKEQIEIDKGFVVEDGRILNNYKEAYIPAYNKATGMYGWLESEAVKQYQGWMISKRRMQTLERYKFKRNKAHN